MKISRLRWQEAQESEYQDWVSSPQVVEKEWKEIKIKYKSYLENLSEKLKITNSWKILDVGCGPTCISRLFKKGDKYGIDPLADKLNLGQKIKGVKIVEGKGEKILFSDNFFNLVICRNVIDHTENPSKVLGEVNRVLKDHGVFILACYVYTPFIKFAKSLAEIIPSSRNIAHPHTLSLKLLENLISEKFRIIKEKAVHTGCHPNDYGKVDEKIGKWSFLERIALFLNFKIFKNNWFVKEVVFICRKNER